MGAVANAVGKLWVTLIQLISVPILVTKWGTSGYGIWLMLTVIPTYVALSDLGFGTAAGVSMIRRVTIGDLSGALRAFQSVWLFVSLVSLALWGLAAVIWLIGSELPGWAEWNREQLPIAALLLMTYSPIVLQMNIVNVGFRSIGRYAQGTFLLDIISPLEQLLVLAVASGGGGYAGCALAMVIMRAVGFAVYYLVLRRTAPWIRFGWKEARIEEVKSLVRPAVAALSLPISSALSIQGTVFVLGLAISPASAAILGTVRTIARVPLQLVGLLTRATLPEITAAETKKDARYLDELVYSNLAAVFIVSVPSAAILIFSGQWLLSLLTRDIMEAPITLFVALTISMVLSALWSTVGSFLLAVNQQHRFAAIYAAASVITAVMVYFVAARLGIEAAAIALIPMDIVMACTVLYQWFGVDRKYRLSAQIDVIARLVQAVKHKGNWRRNSAHG
ncbi:lipopolysaccharide biosynthesis protein [Bradyrhizobium sp. USDA 10063]